METVYFVEAIRKNTKSSNFTSILFNASLYSSNAKLDIGEYFSSREVSEIRTQSFGWPNFVTVNDDVLINANSTPIAKKYTFINSMVRTKLRVLNAEGISKDVPSDKMHSYHINVGHGNCSIVVDEMRRHITLIDCGSYDYLQRHSYQQNIVACIEFIQHRFKITSFKIHCALLTHPHFDHYYGFDFLINQGYIDRDTVMYLNAYYSMPSPILTRILNSIHAIGCRIIEPISNNSSPLINILYPQRRAVRTSSTIHACMNPIIQNNPNNASVIFSITSDQKSFTFTGDAEQSALNLAGTCNHFFRSCNFYSISHHGSENGHIRTACPNGNPITSIANCLNDNTTPILMGRDHAYHGIYSQQVMNDFHNRIIMSEQDPHGGNAVFLEINWNANNFVWHH